MADKIRGFISFADKDKMLQGELRKHLHGLRDRVSWRDHMIPAGMERDEAVLAELGAAHIILLLISADFLASDYLSLIEVKEAMKRHERGEASVIPILLRDVMWEDEPYKQLQYLPRSGKFIDSYDNRDSAFKEVAVEIKEAIAILIEHNTELHVTEGELLPAEMLHDELLKLDYWEQAKKFRDETGKSVHIGAFLIYGAPQHEQAWLLYRLIHTTQPENVDKQIFRYPLYRLSCSNTPKRLWESMGKWLDGRNIPRTPNDIAYAIYDLWQKQSVILILDGLDQVDQKHIQNILDEFWKPLMEKVQRQKQIPNHYLLLFLVDHEGRVENWQIPWSDRVDLLNPSTPPISLKKLREFSPEDIDEWIRIGVNTLPPILTPEEILKEGGTPQVVFQRICDLCNHDWYERESDWLKPYGISR